MGSDFLIRILVCDDDKSIITEISSLISLWGNENKVDFDIVTSESADNVLQLNSTYDIAFIDIEMPGINGLKLSEWVKEKNPDALIFIVTSFQNYLDSAMRIKVFRYLSKPIDKFRFFENLNDAVNEYKNICKTIVIDKKDNVITVKTKDILYIEGKKHGSIIETKELSIQTSEKLSYWYQKINQPNFFVYSHTSFISNLQNVIGFDKENVVFKKSNGEIIKAYMSGRRYNIFKKQFMSYVGEIK